jgi:hypothetical protein
MKPIEDITPGDEVRSFDVSSGLLRSRKVTAVRYSGSQPTYLVKASDGRKLRVTANHPFLSDVSEGLYVQASHLRKAVMRTDGLSDSVEMCAVDVSPSPLELPTWDLEVEGLSNFVAEGFVVHNSRLTMKYPAVWLMGSGAHGEVLSIAFAGSGQHLDAGAKMIHVAPDTSSMITSKSISKGGGRSGYRGLVQVSPGAVRARSFVRCDALILDEESRSDTYPYMEISESDAEIGHEATVSKVGEDKLFYLMSRGLTESQATSMIVAGFIEPIVKELPMEYAVELNRLVELNMAEAGAVG